MKQYYFLLLCLFMVFSQSSYAHTFKPSNVSVDLLADGQFSVQLNTDFIELMQWQLALKGNGDELIAQVRQLSKIQLYKAIKGVKTKIQQQVVFYIDDKATPFDELYAPSVSDVALLLQQNPDITNYRVTFSGIASYNTHAQKFAVFFPEQLGAVNLQIAKPTRALISSGVKSNNFNIKQNSVSDFTLQLSTSLNYIYQGIIHIIPQGFDHILFVLALFLFAKTFSSLLWQISAFTLAHTITLALAVYGIVNVSPAIVEPIIALSIAYVAIENIFIQRLKSQRIVIVFLFGLLHGLGFASALADFGLPKNQWLTSLLSFNVGVELGQLSVIILAFIALGWAQHKSWYRTRVITPLSSVIALVGFYWFIERIFW